MMIFYENIRLALFSLKANKMRALLTMLGIIIGIASVFAIMTVGNSLTTTVTDSMSSMGANNITVGLQQKEQEEEVTDEGMSFEGRKPMKTAEESDYFTTEMLENYCETYADSIVALSATETLGSGQILDGDLYANVAVVGTSLGYFAANDTTLLSGRMFSEKEMNENAKVVLISDKAVDNMFEGDIEAAVGSIVQISVNGQYYNFTVVGVYEYVESAMSF